MDNDLDDVDKRVEWLHSEEYSSAASIFGEPQKATRIGVEYQAEIPSLMTKHERFQLIKGKSGLIGCKTDKDLLAVPCSSSKEPWSEIEHDSFILGLYIFGKNFRLVNNFMGNKGLPNVLSYYYGRFYRSSEHQKWSLYRKKRIRIGKKIFNGWRLNELLSRLHSIVTDKCKASLTQVIKAFEEGDLSFEEYVFSLKDTMGLELLVQSVGIGKGKQDLTIKTRTRLRSTKVQSTCSSLKTEEIVNTLKDRIGLSKLSVNEFFWAAVWPRLLAQGWHYEESRNYASTNSKNLVFLKPGVTKFSRRSLVKGSQYFESLTEVLNKVASEPHLLEHEPDKDGLVEPHATGGSDDEQDLMKYTVVDTSLVGTVKVKELKGLTAFDPADMQASASVSGETNNEYVNHNTLVNNLDPGGQPIRKQKLVFKLKTKCQVVDNIKNGNTRGEDEAMKDAACSEIVIDLNNPRARPGSDDDSINKSTTEKQSVLSETATNQIDSLTPLANGHRHSRRNRTLTTKALEALENGLVTPKKTRRRLEDGGQRHVHAKTAPVSSCGARRDFRFCDSTSVLL
ncbi:uncharacterized protein LOC143582125 [Bidens hawaiensis]|uniref:uncharacterized protein LOC143582125 n=1 Tax=Bidens hawaiensis TaxID=980011 RepID=UPI0040499355